MLEAYCWPPSVDAGGSSMLHVSTDRGEFEVEVVREGAGREVVWRGRGSANAHVIAQNASRDGCGWPAALEIPITREARSGYHSVTLRAGDERADAFLVVRPDAGRTAPILLVLSTTTWNAYNDWGGPSLYTGGTAVTFERPLAPGFLVKPEPARRKMQPHPDREALWFFDWAEPLGLSGWSGGAGWWNWERPFVAWAEANGYAVDVAISQDLVQHPEIVDGHRLLVSVGHDEYWSWEMRDTVDGFVAGGGNLAIFSGNTCFWQVRFDAGCRAMTSYKCRADEDPVVGTSDERLLTSAWVDRRIGRPEASSIGLSFSRGGYSRYGLGVPRASGGYTVWRPEHWAFAGTGLTEGDAFGLADAIVAYEVDGCELAMRDGLPVPTHEDGTPDGLDVLATAPAHLWTKDEQPSRYAGEPGDMECVATAIHGDDWAEHLERYRHNHAVVGCYTVPGGGTVFNAGCTDWAYGLDDPDVATITRNVLNRLSR